MIEGVKERVTADEFDLFVETYSGDMLWSETINVPVKWCGEFWACTSFGRSHSYSYAVCYSVVPLVGWDGPVHVHGAVDEEWAKRAKATGLNWYGFRVHVDEDKSATEFVLGRKLIFVKQPNPKAQENGQNYMNMTK